jgi:5-keto-L-gluconate epimerase
LNPIRLSLAVQTPEFYQPFPVALLSGDFAEKMRKAAQFGADGVELLSINPADLVLTDLCSAINRHGLQVAAIATGGLAHTLGLTLLHQDSEKAALAQQRLFDLIDLARHLNAGLVTVGSFRGRASQVDGDGRGRLAEILYRAAEAAAPRGVRLALEPLNRYESDLINNHNDGLAFIQQVNHTSLGLLLDTYHVNIEESSWTEPFARVMAVGRLFHVHLGDNNRLPPGDGLIDFSAIINTLRQGKYAGFLSAELLAKPDPDTAASRTLSYMRKVMS